jgi:predicted O-linked N-acetylglucosamine transferase (SPINDLY family)
MSPEEQAQRIRDDGVALLIDLGGYTLNSRLQMFALRPAPVQASWLAFPGTSGADFIDYIIGDPVVTPLAHAEDFSECIAQLPVSYQANDELREHPQTHGSRRQAGLPDDGIVFACFNQSYKFSDQMFASWMRILSQVPGSVLWLLVPQEEVQARLRQEAQRRGIAPARLVFAPFVTQMEHLARLPLADIALDTFPCGAHTTCSDALWMGLPLITRVGRSFASRVAASLLAAVGLPELAVTDLADYEALAVRLAQDREALGDIRDHLWDNRRDLPLFDSARFAEDFGQLAQRMVARWQQGLPPAALGAA